MKRTPSGLLVPEGTLPRAQVLIPRAHAKRLQQVKHYFEKARLGLQVEIACEPCSVERRRLILCHLERHDKTGEVVLACGCAERVLQGVRAKR